MTIDYYFVKLATPISRHYSKQHRRNLHTYLGLVYGLIDTTCRSNAHRQCCMRREEMARRCDVSVKTIARCLDLLLQDKFIRKIGKNGRVPVYVMTDKIADIVEAQDLVLTKRMSTSAKKKSSTLSTGGM